MTPAQLTDLAGPAVRQAAEKSARVTHWPERIAWVAGLLLLVALVYWLMREGWKWRATLQSDLPELPGVPEDPGEAKLALSGLYHGSTTAGQWLDRIVAHGLGTRSRAELTLTDGGLAVVRPGATGFFVPASRLRGARLGKGIAGKVVTEDGLLVVTWAHGDRLIDSGFRSDRTDEHSEWVDALNGMAGGTADGTAENKSTVGNKSTAGNASNTENTSNTQNKTEGAR